MQNSGLDFMDTIETDSLVRLEVDRVERWNVFNRLKELSIPCQCACDKPLQVKIETVTAAIQVWSVVQRLTLPRDASIEYLERCWRRRVKNGTN